MWSHGALAQSPVASTPGMKSVFWSFLTKTKQDQQLPSQVHGKIWAHSTQFWFDFVLLGNFFGTHCKLLCYFEVPLSKWHRILEV